MMNGVEIAPWRPSSSSPRRRLRQMRDDAGEDDQRDAVCPMPREVICSPSHIRNIVPPVSVITVVTMKNGPGFTTIPPDAESPTCDAPGLEHREDDRQVAGVLVDDLAAALALLL